MQEFEGLTDLSEMIQNKHSLILIISIVESTDIEVLMKDVETLLFETQLGICYHQPVDDRIKLSIFFRELSSRVPLRRLLTETCDYLIQQKKIRTYSLIIE